jgi:hypothetical protein
MKKFISSLLAAAVMLFPFASFAPVDGQAIQGNGNRQWIPAHDFHKIGAASGSADLGSFHGTPSLFSEISTFGIAGWEMASGDAVSLYFPWPAHLHNVLYPVAARIWFTSDSGDDDGAIDWLLDIEEKRMGQEDAMEAATVALADGIAFAADSSKVAFGVNTTAWDTFTVTDMNTYNHDTLVLLGVELNDEGDTTADEIHFLGVEFLFVPKDYRQSNFHIYGSTTAGGDDHGLTLPRRAGY